MAVRGRDDDRILRWVLRKTYGLRNPSAAHLRNYQHWHAISRRDGFDGLEPPDWRDWPWKLIPPGVTPLVITHPEPAPLPAPWTAIGDVGSLLDAFEAAMESKTARRH